MEVLNIMKVSIGLYLHHSFYLLTCIDFVTQTISDKSQVGKTSVCLGILGSLLKSGYLPSEIAYIKPATQCEEPQLISSLQSKGIACNGIVLWSLFGFTRAFLNGETDSTEKILESIEMAVDEIAKGKRFVVIDGVGYPAVGSICGCSNATIAHRCRAPVVLVGKRCR